MKKRLIIALVLVLCTLILMPTTVYAQSSTDNKSPLVIDAKSSYLIEYETGTVLHQHNGTDARPIASMVKIMTLLCLYDAVEKGQITLEDDVTVSSYAASMGGSQVFLDANTVHKASALVRSIIICSANDSCVALAEHISGSVEGFVDLMNKKARELNLVNSNFVNCTGLPVAGQFSCAADVASMTRQLLSHDDFFTHSKVWMEDYVHPDGRITGMTNTNRLSRFYTGCDGGKTGFTSEAMHCLSATAKRGNTRYIAVVIGANDSKTRFASVSRMLDYAFANYQCEAYAVQGEELGQISVCGGKVDTIPYTVSDNLVLFGRKGKTDAEMVIDIADNIKAPISCGQILGTANLVCDGKVIAKADIVALQDVLSKSYWDNITDIADGW